MQQAKVKKVTSRLLVVLLTLAMVFDYNIAMAYAASNIKLPDNQYLVSQTDNNIAPGIKESQIVSNDKTGNRQNMGYICEVDLANTKTTKIIAGYKDYNGNVWGMQTVREQAKAAEKSTGYNIVAAVNGDFFNMKTGAPTGALVMNGKKYQGAGREPYFAILKDGTAVIRESNVPLDDVKEAIGGETILVKDGKALDFSYNSSINPRTVIGIKPDGKVVTFVNDGRQAPISYGRTYQEIADIMVNLGCETALNLDGGGSTTFLSKPEGSDKLECRNNPSDGIERSVSSSLFIVSTTKASGEFDHAALTPNNLVYTPNSKITFTAKGVDSAGGQAKLPDDISWVLEDSKYGEINSEGVFTSNGTTGEVKVNLMSGGNVVGSTTITIAIPDSITFNNDEVSLGFDKESDLGIMVKYKGRDIIYKDGDIKWTLSDEKLGKFNGNKFISSDSETLNGTATATCAYDESVSGKVNLIIGRLPSVEWDFEDKVDKTTGETIPAKTYYSITQDPTNQNALLYLRGYGRGGKNDAQIVDIDSGSPVRFGSKALKLDYDFTEATGTEGAGLGYNRVGDPVEGTPTAIGMWVYAPEGTPNLWLRMYINDADGNNQEVDFTEEAKISEGKMGGIDWTGWRYLEGSLEGKKAPFSLRKGETIRLMYVPGTGMGAYTRGETKADGTYDMVKVPQSQCKGSIYIDNLQFVYGANKQDTDNPNVDSITANGEELQNGDTINTNTITFKSLYSDVENKNTSGIFYNAVRMYIDGVNASTFEEYANVPGDNALYLYNAKLSNGTHTIKILVRDNAGNETVETRTFKVQGDQEFSTVKLEPTTEGNPILNKTFDLGLISEKIEEVDAVETEIKIHKDFKDYEVKFNDDFDGTATYDSINNVIKIDAKRKDGVSTQTGKQNIATISFKISKDLKKGSVFRYCAQKGLITFNSEQDKKYTKSFSTEQEKLEVIAPLTVKADQMVVGFDGKIYVTDTEGNPVSDATIYKDGSEIGKTNTEGYLQTDILCKTVGKSTIYATKGDDISYSLTVQTTSAAGNEDGLPEYVISNATTGSATSKNITWMSNPKSSDAKAIMQIATKADYDKNGEKAFKNIEGTSKIQSFLGSSNDELNKSVRVNKVLATGLTKNTQYAYRVGDGKQWSEVKTFKTNRNGTNTNFFVIGDTQVSNKENVDKIAANLAKDGNYSFGIQTGDSVDNASIYSHWTDVLQLFGDNYISGVDMVHVLGNHEYMGDLDGDAAQNIYNLPNSGRYSVEYGNVYVATINYTVNRAELKADLEWLKQDAKASKCKWKVLTMHQPAYYTNTAGSNEMINELVPGAAEEAGIDFVFSGHDHSYARTEPLKEGKVNENDGIVYYICGSTGEKSYSVTNNPDFHFAVASQEFNGVYLTVSTTDDKFTVTTRDIDGSIIDSYTKTKVKEECKNGHEYVYDGEYLTCKNCGYSKDLGDYTGFATDEKTGKKMYFMSGVPKKGWFTYGTDIYYFDALGLAEDLTVVEDVPTTCTERGYKVVQNSLGVKKTLKYEVPKGHDFELIGNKYICSVCGLEGTDISTLEIQMGTREIYSGTQRKPVVKISGLVRNVDYTVSYIDNINPGKAKAIIKGKDLYLGTVEKTFTIYRKMNTLEAELEYTNSEYDGKEKTPKVKISGLTEGKDYTISYSNNVNVGEATVTIKGISDYYTGTLTKTFNITQKDMSNMNAKLSYESCEYNGKEREPDVTIEGLIKEKDYTVSYANNVNVGEATITITGTGNYRGSITKTFEIKEEDKNKVDISKYEAKLDKDSYKYTGSSIKPKVTIEGLEENKDFIVNYENNIEIGQAKVTIEGIGNYRGTITKTFEIKDPRIDISTLEIQMGTREIYSGTQRKPVVKISGLVRNVDFTVSYENNINPGKATAIIKGKGSYIGTVTKTFTIYRKMSTLEAELEYANSEYDGKEKTPKVKIAGLTEGKDYTVSYSNNVNVGEATVTIRGVEPYYRGTITKTFTITKQDIETSDLNLQVQNLDSISNQSLNIEDLKEGQDYTVAYNLDQDSNSITIKGIGNYKGQKTLKATKDTEMIVEEDGVQYNLLNDGTAEVYNFTELGKKANIKSKIKDYKVTKINKNAFKDCDKLELVKIPKSLSEIDKDAFKDCKNVTISGKIDSYANIYADENKIDFKESK
ncbi:MAG: phosphodiester glycosidase family protein [Clostridiales bacterium]|nr:phosphodiester glycosidase family protein [Clostridiales bacterium]